MRVGDRPKRAATLEQAGEVISIDEDLRQICLKIGNKAEPFEDVFSLIPPGPLDAKVLREAVYRYAESVIADDGDYRAISSILKREHPSVVGLAAGAAIVPPTVDLIAGSIDAISRLDESHLLVQGPPGTGKTYLSAKAIVKLLSVGKRVGVSSNSHKAINNLLFEIERQALEQKVQFRGAKKCSGDDHYLNGALIIDCLENDEISNGQFDLVAGTAWLFARPEFDQTLDYLFIDEAGQVSLANVVAMGTCASNIVLVGDQMQLGQPMQGAHPGGSGQSALQFVLGDAATVLPDRGIFLRVTRRMHPDVCRFISEAVYEGRLEAEARNATQRLVLRKGADTVLRASGISSAPVVHEDCSQKSEVEAKRIAELYVELLKQKWTNREGITAPIVERSKNANRIGTWPIYETRSFLISRAWRLASLLACNR